MCITQYCEKGLIAFKNVLVSRENVLMSFSPIKKVPSLTDGKHLTLSLTASPTTGKCPSLLVQNEE